MKPFWRWLALSIPLFYPHPSPALELGPVALGSYPQTVLITFKNAKAARRASLEIAPLYHDFKAAFSTRMDDNNLDDLRVAEVMESHGQKGTFFLNDPKGYQGAGDSGVTVEGDAGVEVPARLIRGGHSIGGHTLNHEFLPALSKNALFKEVLGLRVARESLNATCLSSFTYPFVSFHAEGMDPRDREGIEETLRRAGFYLLAENQYPEAAARGFFDGYFLTADGNSWNGGGEEAEVAKARGDSDRPLYLVTMHPWPRNWGGKDYPLLAAQYDKWGGRRDWWNCNINQYAAYRAQALRTKIRAVVRGAVLEAVLDRPLPGDLGDWVPLTLRVRGVKKTDMLEVSCHGATPKPLRATLNEALFDLPHDASHGPLEEFSQTETPAAAASFDDVGKGPGGMAGFFTQADGKLAFALANHGPKPVHDLRVTLRLPLAYAVGVQRREVGTLMPGDSVTIALEHPERDGDPHGTWGSEYLAAQVDYRIDRRGRWWVTRETPQENPPVFFPKDGFLVLGPLAGDVDGFDPALFAAKFLKGQKPAAANPVPWGAPLAWGVPDTTSIPLLDPDIIPTSGKNAALKFYSWDPKLYFPHQKVHYLLWGQVVSPGEKTVRAVFRKDSLKALSLNGRAVEDGVLRLKKGVNDLRILYAPAPNPWSDFSETYYGCYLRLTDGDGNRVTDVRFARPTPP